MKKMTVVFTVLVLLLFSGISFGYSINDSTLVGIGHTWEGGYYGSTDYMGEDFNTYGIDVGFSGSVVTLDIYTKYRGNETAGGVNLGLADIFFNTGSGFKYAIEMGNIAGLDSGSSGSTGLYGNVSAGTSAQKMSNISGNWLYGKYWGTSSNAPSPIVDMIAGSEIGTVEFSKNQLDAEDLWVYSVAFDYGLLGINLGDSFDIFWGTAYCANDIVQGTASAPVPEPATLLLLGTGLIGISGFGKKRFIK